MPISLGHTPGVLPDSFDPSAAEAFGDEAAHGLVVHRVCHGLISQNVSQKVSQIWAFGGRDGFALERRKRQNPCQH